MAEAVHTEGAGWRVLLPNGARYPEGEGMHYLELATGHDAMIAAPAPLASMLLNLA